jgi:hypothetical protein
LRRTLKEVSRFRMRDYIYGHVISPLPFRAVPGMRP